jgi:eukaryotic-like serine/threonine-protein kinase
VEPADLISRLSEDVADGRPIDWLVARSSIAAEDLGTVEQLRALERIAQLHGDTAKDEAVEGAVVLVAPPMFEWGAIRVLERVGAGSFGEVFRAWDTALDREVAVKLLRPDRAAVVRRAAIVLREGQMLARVRHPNVMTVYGAQESNGRIGIWCEFLRGRTLADVVEHDGPFSAQEACLYGAAVCRALAAVHKAGLLHRDVKAQNVMREVGGRVVLMDFGLGRELDVVPPASGRDLAGTPAYLAPELFGGQAASARSDIYAVGVLLFYLVTGEFPVGGASLDALSGAHAAMERRRLEDLRPDLNPDFVRVVDRALAPDAAARYESAGSLLSALVALSGGAAASPSPVRRPLLGILTAGLALSVAMITGLAMRAGSAAPPAFALALLPPQGLTFTDGSRNVPAISPDGRRIAFVATDATGSSQLYLRDLGSLETTAIAGTLGASGPFWAPDGESVGFFTSAGLHRATRAGARSETLVRLWENRGATWGAGDVILFAPGPHTGLSSVPASGGPVTTVTAVDRSRGEQAHMWPQFLPDGSFIVFVLSEDEQVRGIYHARLHDNLRRVLAADTAAFWGDGHLFFVRDGTLYAQEFDPEAGAVVGQPAEVASQVGVTYNSRPAVTVSREGTLVYAPRARDFRRLVWYDLGGRELGMVTPADQYRNPSLSRDGRYLAVEWYDVTSHLRVFDLARGGWTQVNAAFREQLPLFGPGNRLAASLGSYGHLDLFTVSPDRGGAQPIVVSEYDKQASDWSPDGRVLLFNLMGEDGTYDVWAAAADGSGARPLLIGDRQEVGARFSPDGRSIAYVSSESGRPEVYVRTPWDTGEPRRVSTGGGFDPVWRSPDEVLYLDPRGALYAVTVTRTTSDGAADGPPRRLFETTVATPGSSRNHYVSAPDGTKVLFAAPLRDSASSEFVVLGTWRRSESQ